MVVKPPRANLVDSSTLLEDFAEYALKRTVAQWDSREPVMYFMGPYRYLGHAVFETHALKRLYDPRNYKVFVFHPEHEPLSNPDIYRCVFRDLVPVSVGRGFNSPVHRDLGAGEGVKNFLR